MLEKTLEEPATTPVLEVEGLCVDFYGDHGWTRVVDHVDFRIEPGVTLGLVGESGSGKTVTSLAVMGLLPRRGTRVSGSIKLNGRELLGLNDRELEDLRGGEMAMVFQEPRRSLDPAFTVGDQIAEVVRRHEGASKKEAWAAAVKMLEKVGIPDPERRARAYPHQFSGGMCQRVMLAIALACRPKLLIADEPTTALDVTVQKEMLRLMSDLQEEMGLSILFITHDLGVVAEMCDDVSVLYAGQVVERTTLEDLFYSPLHPYTEGLLQAIPDTVPTGGRLRAIPGAVPPPWEWSPSCRFIDRCAYARAEKCDQGPVLLTAAGPTEVRCARWTELSLEGILDDKAS